MGESPVIEATSLSNYYFQVQGNCYVVGGSPVMVLNYLFSAEALLCFFLFCFLDINKSNEIKKSKKIIKSFFILKKYHKSQISLITFFYYKYVILSRKVQIVIKKR